MRESTRRRWCAESLAVISAGLLASSRAVAAPANENPELDVIDCHTHFYDPKKPGGIPWPLPGTPLYRTVLPEHLREVPQARPVTGTIIVEASSRLEDNQWLLDLAADDPFVVGIVGHLDPTHSEYASHLDRFAKNPLFRGIRISEQTLEQLLERRELQAFALLEQHDLELDVNGGPTMPQQVARLAARMPELRIAINHIANVRIDQKAPPTDWAQALRAAGRHAHVYCKVSALVSAAARDGRSAPTDAPFYRPYLDIVWQAFGDDRVIYGSDWPVSESAASYQAQQQIVLDYLAGRGAEATRKFFADNSKAAYKWRERPGRRKN